MKSPVFYCLSLCSLWLPSSESIRTAWRVTNQWLLPFLAILVLSFTTTVFDQTQWHRQSYQRWCLDEIDIQLIVDHSIGWWKRGYHSLQRAPWTMDFLVFYSINSTYVYIRGTKGHTGQICLLVFTCCFLSLSVEGTDRTCLPGLWSWRISASSSPFLPFAKPERLLFIFKTFFLFFGGREKRSCSSSTKKELNFPLICAFSSVRLFIVSSSFFFSLSPLFRTSCRWWVSEVDHHVCRR